MSSKGRGSKSNTKSSSSEANWRSSSSAPAASTETSSTWSKIAAKDPATTVPKSGEKRTSKAEREVTAKGSADSGEKRSNMIHCTSRVNYVWLVLKGHVVTVKVANGIVYEGIFSCSDTPDKNIYLKMPKVVTVPAGVKPPAMPELGESLLIKDYVDIDAKHVRDGGSHSVGEGFRIDGEVSGGKRRVEKELEAATAWVSGPLVGEDFMEGDSSSSSKGWNQFETNAAKFGVKSTYNEDIYTTKLDMSKYSAKDVAKAEAHARDIMTRRPPTGMASSASASALHDEDLDVGGDGDDEEEKFSGVIRGTSKTTTGIATRNVAPAVTTPTPPIAATPTPTPAPSGAWSRGPSAAAVAATPSSTVSSTGRGPPGLTKLARDAISGALSTNKSSPASTVRGPTPPGRAGTSRPTSSSPPLPLVTTAPVTVTTPTSTEAAVTSTVEALKAGRGTSAASSKGKPVRTPKTASTPTSTSTISVPTASVEKAATTPAVVKATIESTPVVPTPPAAVVPATSTSATAPVAVDIAPKVTTTIPEAASTGKQEFKLNVMAKEFVFVPKAPAPAPAPTVPLAAAPVYFEGGDAAGYAYPMSYPAYGAPMPYGYDPSMGPYYSPGMPPYEYGSPYAYQGGFPRGPPSGSYEPPAYARSGAPRER